MQKISGIGGFFFRAKNPETLGQWYEDHFGINSMKSAEVWRQKNGPTVFAPFSADTEYFAQDRQFLLNFRVENLDVALDQLRLAGIPLDGTIIEESVGRFFRIHDPEGNPIELWQPSPEHQWDNNCNGNEPSQ